MTRLILLLITASLIGCGPQPKTTTEVARIAEKAEAEAKANVTIATEIIRVKNCPIYRIESGSHTLYFTQCIYASLAVH